MIGVQPALGPQFHPRRRSSGRAACGDPRLRPVAAALRRVARRDRQTDRAGWCRRARWLAFFPHRSYFPITISDRSFCSLWAFDPNPGWRERELRLIRVIARLRPGVDARGGAYGVRRTGPPHGIGRASAIRDHAQGHGNSRDPSARVARRRHPPGCCWCFRRRWPWCC